MPSISCEKVEDVGWGRMIESDVFVTFAMFGNDKRSTEWPLLSLKRSDTAAAAKSENYT